MTNTKIRNTVIMENHTSLLNYLATTFNLQSYLEIGVQHPENNFDKIFCKNKSGVDPAIKPDGNLRAEGFRQLFSCTSDEFFLVNHSNWDLVFIDGLHHADQVKRDFENSLKCLSENGFIVLHDTLPEKEEYTHVPRDSKVWNGDVYKFACNLERYQRINFVTAAFDHGCTVIWKMKNFIKVRHSKFTEINWKYFSEHKDSLLQCYNADDFINYMNAEKQSILLQPI